MGRLLLTEAETSELLRRCQGRTVRLCWGPGAVWLQPTATWELDELAEIRGMSPSGLRELPPVPARDLPSGEKE